jgi:NAD(P)-dependent dehydrogenase (short-subunit alcohol dehydrogenase family)
MSTIQERNLQGKWRWSPAHPRASAPPSPLSWPFAAQPSPSTTPAAKPPLKSRSRHQAAGGKAIAVQANVADPASIQPLIDTVVTQLGPLTSSSTTPASTNSARLKPSRPSTSTSSSTSTSLASAHHPGRSSPRFNPDGGSIINIGSVAAEWPSPAASVYSATKGAVDSVTVSLSKELGPKKIRVNASIPAWSKPKESTPPASSAATLKRMPR